MIAAGGTRASSITTHSYDDAGTEQWTADHGYTVYCVAADTDGNVYTGGDSISGDSNNTTRKYNSAGSLQWSASHGSGVTVYGIAVDSSGNVYAAGNRTSSVTTRKYNSAGSLQWSRDYHGTTVYCIAVDASGNIYVAGSRTGSKTTKKYDSAGSLQWSVDHGTTVRCIAVDGSGNVYTGGSDSDGNTTRKYDSAGSLQWSVGHGATVYGIAVDSDGNVYTTGAISSGNTTRKYSSSGSLQWSVNFNELTNAIAIDASANIYVAGYLDSGVGLRKYDTSGGLIWGATVGDTLWCVAYASAGLATTLPALSIPLSLAVPSSTGFVAVQALSIPLSLATPTVTSPPLPPELAGLPVARVYRAWLAGAGSELLELAMASFQCVRRTGESTWLAVTLPTYSAGLAATLNARIGGQLIINAGYRLADGSDVLGLFLRATLTAVELEHEPTGATITLTARVTPTSSSPQTRTLAGIQTQVRDDGRYSVTCDVDPLLRPGDTVTASGGASFVVGTIRYAVRPQAAAMELTEAL